MFCTVAVYPHFSLVVTALFCSQCAWWENNLYFAQVFRLADFCLHSLMSSLKVPVCVSRVIPFDIIVALEIFWIFALANSLPFYNSLVSRAMVSAGFYGHIILTAYSSRSISLIAPYLENRCCSMVRADNCPKPVS